ncbi:unnamed protein product [Malus baccata var. baccata]
MLRKRWLVSLQWCVDPSMALTSVEKAKQREEFAEKQLAFIDGLLEMLTVRLQDDNFVKWSFQFQSVLKGYDLFDFFTGDSPCPPNYVINTDTGVIIEITTTYKDWVKKDLALLSLLLVTLSHDAIEHVIGCKTSQKAWNCLQERFAYVSMTMILARDSIMSLKDFRAQLLGAEASIEARMQVISKPSQSPVHNDPYLYWYYNCQKRFYFLDFKY